MGRRVPAFAPWVPPSSGRGSGSLGCGHGHRLQGPSILADGVYRTATQERAFLSREALPGPFPPEEPLHQKDSRRVHQRAFENSNYASFQSFQGACKVI